MIVVLSGGTGVGTSTYAGMLARHLEVSSVISTDAVREVIRSILTPEFIPALYQSTYTAGKTEHYHVKSIDAQRAETLRGYKHQRSPVETAVQGIINRALIENQSLVVEGVHLTPGNYYVLDDRIREFCIHISDETVHKERFTGRAQQQPDRREEKYLPHFREIRWIHDYVVRKAKESSVSLVDNIGTVDDVFSTFVERL